MKAGHLGPIFAFRPQMTKAILMATLIFFTAPTVSAELDRAAEIAYARQFEFDSTRGLFSPIPLAQTIWDDLLKSGWPDLLSPFKTRFQPGKSYLTLYKKFPRWPIDMRSPDRFKRSVGARELSGKPSIGHMAIGWSCATANFGRREGFAAQTGEDSGQSYEMLRAGWGMNAVLATFTDGRIQNGHNIQSYFSNEFVGHIARGQSPAPYFALVIEVPSSDCEAVQEFVKSYVLHPAKPWKNFGMRPDPSKFEGAGCGSFASAALERAPSFAPVVESYWRTLSIPKKLFGLRTRVFLPNVAVPFSYAKTAAEERPISPINLMLKNWDSGEEALNLRLVDPELAIYSLRKFVEISMRGSGQARITPYQIENFDKTRRVYNFAGSNVDDHYPETNHDSGYQEIDENFDPSFARVSAAVESWWTERQSTSRLQVISIPYGVGIMIDSKPTP